MGTKLCIQRHDQRVMTIEEHIYIYTKHKYYIEIHLCGRRSYRFYRCVKDLAVRYFARCHFSSLATPTEYLISLLYIIIITYVRVRGIRVCVSIMDDIRGAEAALPIIIHRR